MTRVFRKITQDKKFNFKLNIFLIVIILIIVFIKIDGGSKIGKKITREQIRSYQYTNPILDCENDFSSNIWSISHSELKRKVSQVKNTYGIEEISVYLRDLNNGPWLGVNEDQKFLPASLLKIPIAMSLMKYAEDNIGYLDTKVTVTEEDLELNQIMNIKTGSLLEANKEYTLMEVMESLIKESDNSAILILDRYIPSEYLYNVFSVTGVPTEILEDDSGIKVREYASFFRVLFNASYLSRSMSEKLLILLAQTSYKNGIVAGLPKDEIEVAHKFGERKIGKLTQLHDCGIVYYPENPYLLCIMTRGSDFFKQQVGLEVISRFIYSEIAKEGRK